MNSLFNFLSYFPPRTKQGIGTKSQFPTLIYTGEGNWSLGLCLLVGTNPRSGRHRGWLGDGVGTELPVTGTNTHRGHGCDLRGLLGQGGQHMVSTEAITARSGAAKPTADRAGIGGSLPRWQVETWVLRSYRVQGHTPRNKTRCKVSLSSPRLPYQIFKLACT